MTTKVIPCTKPDGPGVYIARRHNAMLPRWQIIELQKIGSNGDLAIGRFGSFGFRHLRDLELDEFEFREKIVIEQ